MVNIGIMRANDLIIDAFYESSELMIYAETDAAADAQWHPLDAIAKDYVRGRIKERAARSLFKKALSRCDFLYEHQCLSLDDVVESNERYSESIQALRECAWESCIEGEWFIVTDHFDDLNTGTTIDPFQIVDVDSIQSDNVIIVANGFIYFVRTDNVVDGWEVSQWATFDGKSYPMYQVTLRPEPKTVIGKTGPTYGPPKEVMELLAISVRDRIAESRESFEQVLKEAERGW